MPKITGTIKQDDRPFSGMIIVTALNGTVKQVAVKSGKLDEQLELSVGYYSVSMVPSDARKQSSYPQYKWRVPEGEAIEFEKIEIEQLV